MVPASGTVWGVPLWHRGHTAMCCLNQNSWEQEDILRFTVTMAMEWKPPGKIKADGCWVTGFVLVKCDPFSLLRSLAYFPVGSFIVLLSYRNFCISLILIKKSDLTKCRWMCWTRMLSHCYYLCKLVQTLRKAIWHNLVEMKRCTLYYPTYT